MVRYFQVYKTVHVVKLEKGILSLSSLCIENPPLDGHSLKLLWMNPTLCLFTH